MCLKKITVSTLVILFICLQARAQQNMFIDFTDLRNIEEKSDYLKIDSLYTKGQEKTIALRLDSLANVYLRKENYSEFLFCKNQEARLYKKKQNFKQAVDTLISSRKKFRANSDTLNIEYIISYYINVFIPPRYYSNKFKRHEIIDRGIALCRLMNYEKLEIADNPFIKLLQFGTKEAFYRRDFQETRLKNAELRAILKQKQSYYELADMDRTFFSKIATDERDLQQTITIAHNAYIDLIKNNWDAYEGYHDLAAEVILRLSKTPINLYIQQGEYQKAIDLYKKVPLNLISSNSIFLADAHVCLACLYLKVNDTIHSNTFMKKALNDVYSKKFFVDNRSLLLSNFAMQLYPFNAQLASQLIDTAINITKNKHRIDYAGFAKLSSLKKNGEYAEAISWSQLMFNTDTTGGNKKVIFNFEKLIHRFLSSMDLTICAYQEFLNTGNPAIKNLFENQAIETHHIYTEFWNQNVSSHELNNIQNDYNVYFDEYILRPYQNGFNFELIDKRFISELILTSKSQATLNSINRIAKENSSNYNDSLFQAYSTNLKNIQDYKNKVFAYTPESMVDSVCLTFFDLIYENYWLRYDINCSNEQGNEIRDTINTIEQFQNKLMPKQAIVEYYVTDSSVYSILITKGSYDVHFELNSKINKLTDEVLRDIKTGSFKSANTNKLSQILFPENWDAYLKNIDHLTIIPHSFLNKIPFEILAHPTLDGQKLVDTYTITYNYSSQIWLNLEGRQKTKEQSIILSAPFAKKTFLPDSVLISDNYRGDISLPILPYSGNEVNGIFKLFRKNKLKCVSLTGQDATEANYRKLGHNYTITHFATHGYVNDANYEKSGVYFYNNSMHRDSLSDNNFFSLGEVYALNTRPDLVVLSGCKTGTGKIVEGEGVMALPRGFIYAGVPNVIASLWKVHDEKTKDLMVAFYKHLLEDKVSYAEALRRAKLDCIAKGFLPMDWAGFVLIGS